MSTTDDTNAARRGSESNDLLGQAPERAAFEAWIATQPGHPFAGVYTTLMRKAWNAAVAAERERLKADAEKWGDALNSAGWAVTEAYRKHTGKVEPPAFFNHAKAILRDGIAAYFAALKA